MPLLYAITPQKHSSANRNYSDRQYRDVCIQKIWNGGIIGKSATWDLSVLLKKLADERTRASTTQCMDGFRVTSRLYNRVDAIVNPRRQVDEWSNRQQRKRARDSAHAAQRLAEDSDVQGCKKSRGDAEAVTAPTAGASSSQIASNSERNAADDVGAELARGTQTNALCGAPLAAPVHL